MGVYCEVSDVQLRIGGFAGLTIGVSSTPSTDGVSTLIADAEAEVHSAMIDSGYRIPATSAYDVAFLRGKIAPYVTYQVHVIAFGYDEMPANLQAEPGTWTAFIEALRKGRVAMQGQDHDSDRTLKRVSFESGLEP